MQKEKKEGNEINLKLKLALDVAEGGLASPLAARCLFIPEKHY